MSKHGFNENAERALREEWDRQARHRIQRMRDEEDSQLRRILGLVALGLILWGFLSYVTG